MPLKLLKKLMRCLIRWGKANLRMPVETDIARSAARAARDLPPKGRTGGPAREAYYSIQSFPALPDTLGEEEQRNTSQETSYHLRQCIPGGLGANSVRPKAAWPLPWKKKKMPQNEIANPCYRA